MRKEKREERLKEKKPSALREYSSLIPYLRKYRFKYALGFFFLLAVDAALIIIPQFMRRAVDTISSGGFKMPEVLFPAAVMVGLMTLISFGRFLWRYFIHGSSRRIEAAMRQNLFEHLLSLSYDFFEKNKIGDLMARATNDLNAVRESIGMGLVALIDGTIMAAAILIIIFVQDTRTAAWAVLPLPLITILILIFGNAIGRRFRRSHEAYSALSDAVQESFAGIRVVKSFVKEWWFIKKFADCNDEYRDANMGLVRLFGVFFPFVSFLSGLTVLIVLLVGGIRVIEGNMTAGGLVALFRYLQMLIWPLIGAGFVVNMIQRGAVSIARYNEVMRSVPAIRSPEVTLHANINEKVNERARETKPPLIDIRNLSFEYSGAAGKKILEGINLSIPSLSVTGILGRTGSGKSTLIKTLMRMIDPPAGTVFIKGIESALWDLPVLRSLFACTPQDSYLFSDSIKNNLAYALDEQGDEKTLKEAASSAALERDLSLFTHGWDTVIGERGLSLSGGQKQRTAIARSLAARREILILDDSLSAVDTETEKKILDNLFAYANKRKKEGLPFAMIIISHRISALSRADNVIVLEAGKIIEQGSPEDLINLNGFYSRTAALQSINNEEWGMRNGE